MCSAFGTARAATFVHSEHLVACHMRGQQLYLHLQYIGVCGCIADVTLCQSHIVKHVR